MRHTFRKLLSVLLAIVMVSSMVSAGFAADAGLKIELESATVNIANGATTVTVPVKFINNPGLIGLQFTCTAPEGWTVSEIAENDESEENLSFFYDLSGRYPKKVGQGTSGNGIFAWGNSEKVTPSSEYICWITYSVPANILNGDYEVTLDFTPEGSKILGESLQDNITSNVTVVPGKITVTGGVDPSTLYPTVTTAAKNVTYTYKDTAPTLSVTAQKPANFDSGTDLTYAWFKGSSAKPAEGDTQVENAETNSLALTEPETWTYPGTEYYYCKVTNTYDGKTYTTTSDVITVTYAKAQLPTATLGNADNLVYDGQEKTVTVTVGGLTATNDYTVEGTLAATNAGSYNVTVKPVETGNYIGADQTLTWNIAKADYKVTGTKAITIYSTGAEFTIGSDVLDVKTANDQAVTGITYSGTYSGVTVTSDGKLTAAKGTQPGTFNVTATIPGDTNHNPKTETIAVTVKDKTDISGTVSFTAKSDANLTYDPNGKALSMYVNEATCSTSGFESATPKYLVDGTEKQLTDTVTLDAGAHTITAVFEDDTHYGAKDVKITIEKATVTPTVTWANYTADGFTYDGTEKSITPSVSPATVEITSTTGNTGTDAGEYTAKAALALTAEAQKNYTLSAAEATQVWKINKAATLTADAIEQSVRYSDGATKTISAADIKKDGNAIAGLTISSVAAGTDTNNILKTDSLTVTGGVAEYAINTADVFDAEKTATFTITGTSKNYTAVTATVTVKRIDKIPVDAQVTFPDQTATYNGTAQGVSATAATFTGTKDGDGAITYKYSTGMDGAWSDTAPTNAGTYMVQATYEDNSQRGKKEAAYTINKAPLTITGATVTEKDYDATDNATITAVQFSGLVSSESLTLTTDYTVSDAKFSSKNFGTDIPVTFTVALVTGADNTAKNYTLASGAGTAKGNINKKDVTASAKLTLTPPTSAFNNAVQTPTVKVTYDTDKEMAASEYTVTYAEGRTDVGTYAVTVAPKDSSNYTFDELSANFEITKATATVAATVNATGKAGTEVTVKLPELTNPGTDPAVEYAAQTPTGDSILEGDVSISGSTLTCKIASTATEGQTATIPVKITSQNYTDTTVSVVVTATEKDIPQVTAQDVVKTYNNAALTLDEITKSNSVDGEWSFVGDVSGVKNANTMPYDVTLKFAPTETDAYAAVEVQIKVTINKATPTVTPTFTPITEAGKTLDDAALTCTVSPDTVTGTIAWDDGDATVVVANQSYGWTFTPTDTTNYETATGTLIPFVQNPPDETEEPNVPPILPPSGGNGSGSTGGGTGGSGSGSGNQGGSTTNPDQSVTTTTTDRDGNVTTTTTYPDGSKSVVEMKTDGTIISTDTDAQGNTATVTQNPDGSSVKTVENIDGSSSIQNTTSDGQTSAMVNLPSETVDASNASGAPASLPMDAVTATKDSASAPVVMVNTANDEPVKVEIPVTNANNGTVAVLVKADGTEEIIKTTALTGSGVAVKVNSGDTVKIIDNTKTFSDTATHWGSDAVTFVAARELFSGTSETRFSPDDNMTRGMLMTVLARYENVDTNGGSVWYEKGVAWAVAQGLSDGTNPNGQISREQLATIIYRYAQSKGIDTTAGGSLERFPDAGSVSDWAREAMSWAVGNGIISGVGGVTLDPSGNATRAQVATILMRFSEKFPA